MNEPRETPTPVITDQQAKRVNAPIGGMIISVLVCALAFLPIWLLNAFPKEETYQRNINVQAEAERVAPVAKFQPLSPQLPNGWTSNFARWTSGGADGVSYWEVGFVTAAHEFLSITQTAEANPTWLAQQTEEAPRVGQRTIDGHSWTIRHQPEVERSLVLEWKGTTVIITGTASDQEFDILASAVTDGLASAGGSSSGPSPEATSQAISRATQ
ncbi:DUF4245 domain-containing protein [Arthrobacter castelli]|uniref:DUF4245 domain-containing protein n=1 Tax=Arthrobacter castelli TaxID=271431 RepID=UPI00040A1A73|nr:DUF4245 domain-containing protein [Arthrobacter castelli]